MWIEKNTIVHTSSRSYLPHDNFIVIFYDSYEPFATTQNQYLCFFLLARCFCYNLFSMACNSVNRNQIGRSMKVRLRQSSLLIEWLLFFNAHTHAHTHPQLPWVSFEFNKSLRPDNIWENRSVSLCCLEIAFDFQAFLYFLYFIFCVDLITVLYKWLNLFNWNTRNHKIK